ncbi:uncharacterized protein CcaverHIS019_0702330 [Cutaneotrichosporon cavernicola]|uniref:Uncharacterized protein n=1 Tax=Cutaneotrichosporon cavernicola TaxID=279322 RepID=A0AA48QYK9_9TREE|nr:uncharacterized protein CcaverHIS019_0702330 [Cutaneotrichosporon cavernicola]BEI94652.1 hypothetical protein CcaverHIS019_0702330 [Cutaneotrichosporon cavernicola]
MPASGPPEAIHPIPPGDNAILALDQMRFLGRDRQFPEAQRCGITIDDDMCDALIGSANNLIKHIEVHLARLRALSNEQLATTFFRLGCYPVHHDSIRDIEQQAREYGDKMAEKYCPIADCPHPKIIKPEQHYSSLALHGSEPFTRQRLRPPITLQPVQLSHLPPLPTAVAPYNITCHEIQPFRGQGEGPRKNSPENNFPIIPVDCRKGDPLMIANGSGIPDERGMSVYWSSDFFRPIDEVDSDDENATVGAASVPGSSMGTGMMGTGKPVALSRGRRSVSVLSDATFLPDSPQSAFAAGISRLPSLPAVSERRSTRSALVGPTNPTPSVRTTPAPSSLPSSLPESEPGLSLSRNDSLGMIPTRPSTPIASQPRPSRTAASSSMLPPLGIDRDGMIKLTRHVPFPPWHKPVPQGMSGSSVTVGPPKIILREIMNPLQYVRQARQRAVDSNTGESTNELDAAMGTQYEERDELEKDVESSSKADSAPLLASKARRKRKRLTDEQIDKAAHAYAQRKTGVLIGFAYWTAYSNFLDDNDHHVALVEEEDIRNAAGNTEKLKVAPDNGDSLEVTDSNQAVVIAASA